MKSNLGRAFLRRNTLVLMLPFLFSCTMYSMFDNGMKSLSNIDPVDPSSFDQDKDGIASFSSTQLLPYTYKDLYRSKYADTVDSTGDVRLLVVPIEFVGYEFKGNFETDLNLALSGDNNESLHSESLASFYKKSSFGKLNLNFSIAPIYKTGLTPYEAYQKSFTSAEELGLDDTDNAIYLVQAAVESARQRSGFDFKQFDRDGNGNIDGVIAVYSCPNSRDNATIGSFDTHVFYWAYTYWALKNANREKPTLNTYFWMSYDFLYNKEGGLDGHTLIHEFGHMMGLDDYYIEDSCPYKDVASFLPLGLSDMMDGNILDHNAFSKAILGWIEPKVIYDSAVYQLEKANKAGDCFLIPSSSWNGTLFDEYFLVELYTPDGLNELDSTNKYPNRPLGFTIPGVKIYHVDARVVATTIRLNGKGGIEKEESVYYNGADIKADHYGYERRYFEVGASNCSKNQNRADVHFSLIHLMEATGVNTFMEGSFFKNETLFQEGDEFTLDEYGYEFMPKIRTLNNGDAFPFSIRVDSVNNEKATITITKSK